MTKTEVEKIKLLAMISSVAVLKKYSLLKKLIIQAKKLKVKPGIIYEALLQTYLFAGFPSAILSLQILNNIYPARTDSEYEHDEYKLKLEGEKNCRKIYGRNFEKLIYNVNSFSPELSEWLVIEGYGKVFSRKGLSLKQRELLIVSILASLEYESQLFSHISGAVRLKISLTVIESVIDDLEKIKKGKSRFGMKVLREFKIKKGLTPLKKLNSSEH